MKDWGFSSFNYPLRTHPIYTSAERMKTCNSWEWRLNNGRVGVRKGEKTEWENYKMLREWKSNSFIPFPSIVNVFFIIFDLKGPFSGILLLGNATFKHSIFKVFYLVIKSIVILIIINCVIKFLEKKFFSLCSSPLSHFLLPSLPDSIHTHITLRGKNVTNYGNLCFWW